MSYERLIFIPMFLNVAHDALETVYASGEIIKKAPGEIIIREGEINHHMYVLLGGEVGISLPESDQRFSQVLMGTRGPGECLGEYSFLDHQLASATVTIKQPAELFKITHVAFNQILDSDPGLERILYKNMLLLLVNRLRTSDAELDMFRPI